jgi:hypothetical protein
VRGVGTGNGEHSNTRSFMICAAHQILSGRSSVGGQDVRSVWHIWGEKRVIFTVLLRKPEGKRPLGKPRYRWEVLLKLTLKIQGEAWTEFIWLRTGISGGLLRIWQRTSACL